MNISIPASQISENFFKNKEHATKIKEKMNRFIWNIINSSNNLEVEPPEHSSNGVFFQYGFKIGPGNNSFVIRRLMNERWWWNIHEKQSGTKPHFRWTQWRKNSITNQIMDNKEFCEKYAQPSKVGKKALLFNLCRT